VEVLVKDRVVATLGEGGFFGEIALLFESKRTASIRSKTYCDLSVLRKADLDKVAKSFPGIFLICRDNVQRKGCK
jgi:CRP-like cAMP-binding protein